MALTCRVEEPSTASIAGHRRLFDPLVGAARGRQGHVERPERVHPLVLTHQQLDRVLSEIEADLS